MFKVKSIVRHLFVLLAVIVLVFSAFGSIAMQPVHAKGMNAPAGLSPDDWTQIKAQMPANSLNAQQAYIKASATDEYSVFGTAISLDSDTLVVGAPDENGGGGAYVFTRSGGVWSQQAHLKASNAEFGDWFGYSVAISGDTLVVGAKEEDSSALGVNGDDTDNSAQWAGAVYVFTRSGTDWTQQAYIKASNTEAEDYFGSAVAISSDTLVVGAPGEDSADGGNQADNLAEDSGAVYVFTRSGNVWSQQAYIKASTIDIGDIFGSAVAIVGDSLVVGAPYESSNATGINGDETDNSSSSAGAAYVFTRSGSVWSQQAYIKASNPGAYDHFGFNLAISGDTLVVGATGEDSNAIGVDGDQSDNSQTNSGAAYVFTRSGSVWSQQAYLKSSNSYSGFPHYEFWFGSSVAIDGDLLIVGASGESSNATGVNGTVTDHSYTDAGAAYVFNRNGSAWVQKAYLKASNTDAGDGFGDAVAVSNDTLAVGAPYESSNATGIDGDQTDNSLSFAGAVYVSVLPMLVSSITLANANPTNAASVDFTVSFSEPVSGVDAGDFTLTTTNTLTGASVTGVSGGPQTYTVSVNTGAGSGDLRLDVTDDDTILSVATSQPLGGTGSGNGDYTIGENYILDRVAPTVSAFERFNLSPTNLDSVDFKVTFSKPVTGVDASDFAITTSGISGASITSVVLDGSFNYRYIVSVNTGTGVGTLGLNLVDDDTIVDAVGNPLGGTGAGNGNASVDYSYSINRTHYLTFNSAGKYDGWILESSENSNAGGKMSAGATTLQLGDDASNKQYRSILSFNTSALPDNATILSVRITIYQSGAVVGSNPFSALSKLWADIRKGSFGATSLQLSDFSAPASATKVGSFTRLKPSNWYTSTLSATGRNNINKTGITQFRLYFTLDDNNNLKSDLMKFISGNLTGSQVPVLAVGYTVP